MRGWALARRPEGLPQETDVELVEAPTPWPGEGEALIESLYLSVDPGTRPRLSADTYAAAFRIGEEGRPFRQAFADGTADGTGFGKVEHPLPGGVHVHDAVMEIQDDDAIVNAFDDGIKRHGDDVEGLMAGDASVVKG